MKRLVDLASEIVGRAMGAGADVAEAQIREGGELSAKVRLGEPELIEESDSRSIGLRVIRGGRSAITYTSDATPGGIAALVADALELAALSQPDEHAGPPDPSLLARESELPDLDLFDPAGGGVDAAQAIAAAKAGEDAARAFDPRITNSEGASFSRTAGTSVLVTSGGFRGAYRGSYLSLVVNPIADEPSGKKQTGYHWDARRHLAALEPPESVGREAARRTLAKLGARKVESCEVPVVFDPDAGRALLSLLFGCVSGTAIYRRASYLIGREGETVASPLVEVVDDPLIPCAPGSRPFDGEGLPSRRNVVISGGVLRGWLLDTYSGRKLGKPSTGNASRSVGSAPSVAPTNFHLLPGKRSAESIVSEVDRGLYVTSMMGFGFNPVTGDFSRGAEGFWIEKGRKTFPVGEITISLGFDDLWKRVDAVADDLVAKTAFACPTFRVSRMTLAGT